MSNLRCEGISKHTRGIRKVGGPRCFFRVTVEYCVIGFILPFTTRLKMNEQLPLITTQCPFCVFPISVSGSSSLPCSRYLCSSLLHLTFPVCLSLCLLHSLFALPPSFSAWSIALGILLFQMQFWLWNWDFWVPFFCLVTLTLPLVFHIIIITFPIHFFLSSCTRLVPLLFSSSSEHHFWVKSQRCSIC